MGFFDDIGRTFESVGKTIANETTRTVNEIAASPVVQDVASVTKDVGTSATRIVTDTALDVADVTTGFQFSDDLDSAKKTMSDAGVLSAADAIEKNHYGFLVDMEKEAKTKNAEISRLLTESNRIALETNNRSAVLEGMLLDVDNLIIISDEVNKLLEKASKIQGWNKWAEMLDISSTPVNDIGKYASDWNEIGQRIIVARMSVDSTSSVAALASLGLLAKASKLTKLSKLSKASKFVKIGKLAGRSSAVLAIASVGLDIGLTFVELEAKKDQLEQLLKDLNSGIAEANGDLTESRREVREINLRISELLSSVEPKQQEDSWQNWVDDKTDELKVLRSRLVSFEGIRDTAIKLAQSTRELPYDVRVAMIEASDPSIDNTEAKSIIILAEKAMVSDLQPKPALIDPIRITNQYVWLPEEYKLPLSFSCNVVFSANSDEFVPCFSQTKAKWGSKDCDALSWFFSPHRHDFTFRTGLFKGFPETKRPTNGFNAEVGKNYRMRCEISSSSATYWIDDQEYATATYDRSEIPQTGFIGFAVYGVVDITVDDIVIASA